MNDRDRLAADLHSSICDYHWPDLLTCGIDHADDADRLIALGWTRLDERRERVIHAAFDVDGAWDAGDEDGSPILWLAEAGEVLLDLRTAIEALDDGEPWYSVLRESDTPIRTVMTPDGIVYRPDLDEERLARALHRLAWGGGSDGVPDTYEYDVGFLTYSGEATSASLAAAIAKAYREDTE